METAASLSSGIVFHDVLKPYCSTNPEWPNGLQHCSVIRMVVVQTTNTCGYIIYKYVDQKGVNVMLPSKQSTGVAPEVSLMITQVRKHTSKGSTLALKPRADVTRRPKQGHQWSHKRDLWSQFFKLKSPAILPYVVFGVRTVCCFTLWTKHAAQMIVGSSPEPPPILVDMSASAWIKKAWLPCWPLGESKDHTSDKAWKGSHPSFETQGRRHQKSKTGVSVAPRKRPINVLQTFLKKDSGDNLSTYSANIKLKLIVHRSLV